MFKFFKKFTHRHFHEWVCSYMVGDFHKYRCSTKTCNEKLYTLETTLSSYISNEGEFEWIEPTKTVLTEEEAQKYIEPAENSLKATRWLLDNVEPTVSAGRQDDIDYQYKIKNGTIVHN